MSSSQQERIPTSIEVPRREEKGYCSVCYHLDPNLPLEIKSGLTGLFPPSEDLLEIEDLPHERIEQSRWKCRFCMLLYSAIMKFSRNWQTIHIKVKIGRPVNIQIGLWAERAAQRDRFAGVELYTPLGQNVTEASFATAREISAHSASDDVFDFIDTCLKTCMETHEKCVQPTQSLLPKRIVYICPQGTVLRLIEGQGRAAAYTALSHCWGGENLLKTTTQTLSQRKASLDWDSLPKTFQDAITVTKRLGFQYLWIDSLCIIQDSKYDWEIESAKMATIYENAIVTIAGVSSSGGSIPFLTPRPASSLTSYDFHLTNDQGASTLVRARLASEDCVYGGEPSEPLNSRGWTLQERLLSTRVLHYTSRDLKWECKTVSSCECQTWQQPPLNLFSGQVLPDLWTDTPYKVWHFIVGTFYTTRRLTYSSDVFPAISGLATKVHELTGSKYLAGLWMNNLLDDLCWRVDDSIHGFDFSMYKPAVPYRSPSFSWASLEDSPIWYENNVSLSWGKSKSSLKHDAQVLSAHCSPSGQDPYGQVADGFIKISGFLLQLQLACEDPVTSGNSLFTVPKNGEDSQKIEDVRVHPDTPLVEYSFCVSGQEVKSLRRASKEEANRPFAAPIWLLSICLIDGYRQGLALRQSSTVPGAYERIGFFKESSSRYPTWFDGAEQVVVTIV